MANEPDQIKVAGAGIAESRAPLLLRFLRLSIYAGFFFMLLALFVFLSGWDWLVDGLTPTFAGVVAAMVAAASGALMLLARNKTIETLLAMSRSDSGWVYRAFRESWRRLAGFGLALALWISAALITVLIVRSSPLPEQLATVRMEILAPNSEEKLVPIYFWDYATWVSPTWLDTIDLIIPYEKGPPAKLLSKIYFQSEKSLTVDLELSGRRPRVYDRNEVYRIFGSNVLEPGDWPLVWHLMKEAGLTLGQIPVLSMIQLTQAGSSTDLIGVPWNTSAKGSGRVFLWGPGGTVFQAKCAKPCALSRMLELAQFPPDPKGSFKERLEWTKQTLKRLLAETPMVAKDDAPEKKLERERHEKILILYLFSLLTLDPRDPEAFFHIGKLSKNKETVSAAIRYGRDLGLDSARQMELESRLRGL